MVSKEKLIRTLKDSADLEEVGAMLITTVLKRRIEKSSLSPGKRQRLVEIADIIKEETGEHKGAIIELIRRVEGGEQAEF